MIETISCNRVFFIAITAIYDAAVGSDHGFLTVPTSLRVIVNSLESLNLEQTRTQKKASRLQDHQEIFCDWRFFRSEAATGSEIFANRFSVDMRRIAIIEFELSCASSIKELLRRHNVESFWRIWNILLALYLRFYDQ